MDCIYIREYHQDDRENVIEVKTKSETFLVQAESTEDKVFWVTNLTEAVTKYSGIPPSS